MNSKSWLVRRALLAIGLMVGFYVLALAIVGGLLWIPYAEWQHLNRIHPKIAFACVVAAGTVLWAILPRPDRFEPPGPRLDEARCPELFRMIREVAAATGQPEPTDVYLVNEVNAWVTQRGGVMGFGSHRVMGIGLPLMQGISEQELKAIIAHEFGHYASGDVGLGPWIYKTRAAIGRTLESMGEDSWLQIPFNLYGKLFLRVTHAVSRQQEFIADQIAAKVGGVAAAASALRRVTATSTAFNAFTQNELVPAMRQGFLPPIVSGFDAFLKSKNTIAMSSFMVKFVESQDTTDPFDTHPSLKQRLEALGATGESDHAPLETSGSAARLLPDAEKEAIAAIRSAYGAHNVDDLKPVSWDALAECIYLPQWRATAKAHAKWLARFTPDTLPTTKQDLIRAGSGLVRSHEEDVDDDDRMGRAVHVLGVGLGLALIEQGWELSTGIGEPIVVRRGDEVIDAFGIVRGLGAGEADADEWKARCSAFGISGRALGAEQPTYV